MLAVTSMSPQLCDSDAKPRHQSIKDVSVQLLFCPLGLRCLVFLVLVLDLKGLLASFREFVLTYNFLYLAYQYKAT